MSLNTVTADQTTGLLKTANNLSEISAKDEQTTPIGSVKAYAGATVPKSWLLCNGGSYSQTTYAALYAVVGTTFGGGGGNFNVPNIANLATNVRYIIKSDRYTP